MVPQGVKNIEIVSYEHCDDLEVKPYYLFDTEGSSVGVTYVWDGTLLNLQPPFGLQREIPQEVSRRSGSKYCELASAFVLAYYNVRVQFIIVFGHNQNS